MEAEVEIDDEADPAPTTVKKHTPPPEKPADKGATSLAFTSALALSAMAAALL